MSLSAADFEALLDSAERSAVHLETRDVYSSGEESADFQLWQRTGEAATDPEAEHWAEWTGLVRRTVARGVRIRRARIVSEPVTDYIRYEHLTTSVNLAIGEEVRWLPRRKASDILLPGNDFWLMDGQVVLWNHFTGNGGPAGHEITDDPHTAGLCAAAFEAVWRRGVAHEKFDLSPPPVRRSRTAHHV